MLNKDWLLTVASNGFYNPKNKEWNPVGAGVFIQDKSFTWYVTAYHHIHPDLQILVNSKTHQTLVDIQSLHRNTRTHWIHDQKLDIAATLFPMNENYQLKSIPYNFFLSPNQIFPSMSCYSIGCPYDKPGFSIDKNELAVLNGIVSYINKDEIFTTTPIFPGNIGGPLIISHHGINNNVVINHSPQLYLAGIILESIVISNELNPIYLKKVRSTKAISHLLQNPEAIALKNKISKN